MRLLFSIGAVLVAGMLAGADVRWSWLRQDQDINRSGRQLTEMRSRSTSN